MKLSTEEKQFLDILIREYHPSGESVLYVFNKLCTEKRLKYNLIKSMNLVSKLYLEYFIEDKKEIHEMYLSYSETETLVVPIEKNISTIDEKVNLPEIKIIHV